MITIITPFVVNNDGEFSRLMARLSCPGGHMKTMSSKTEKGAIETGIIANAPILIDEKYDPYEIAQCLKYVLYRKDRTMITEIDADEIRVISITQRYISSMGIDTSRYGWDENDDELLQLYNSFVYQMVERMNAVPADKNGNSRRAHKPHNLSVGEVLSLNK